ncbi:MAG: DEAD/DEAH box helicase, partial [Nannocystaceae bacterium]
MSTTFAQLGVPTFICQALERRGITEAFEIQEVTVRDGLAGRDILGRAPTGSGKTIAFGIPVIARAQRARAKKPTSLILSPTRELAEQINKELKTFAGRVRIGVVYGGVSYRPQLRTLSAGVDVLVACPGRLEDLIAQKVVSLEAVSHVVLDEADRMADMGFTPA